MLYKLIFDFIVPVYNTTKQVKQKMNDIHRTVNEQAKKQQSNQFTSTTKEASSKPNREDYIDYEEVK
ncbi:MAG: hypothetical protein WDM90_00750 [Ferruginibacter sp.]